MLFCLTSLPICASKLISGIKKWERKPLWRASMSSVRSVCTLVSKSLHTRLSGGYCSHVFSMTVFTMYEYKHFWPASSGSTHFRYLEQDRQLWEWMTECIVCWDALVNNKGHNVYSVFLFQLSVVSDMCLYVYVCVCMYLYVFWHLCESPVKIKILSIWQMFYLLSKRMAHFLCSMFHKTMNIGLTQV